MRAFFPLWCECDEGRDALGALFGQLGKEEGGKDFLMLRCECSKSQLYDGFLRIFPQIPFCLKKTVENVLECTVCGIRMGLEIGGDWWNLTPQPNFSFVSSPWFPHFFSSSWESVACGNHPFLTQEDRFKSPPDSHINFGACLHSLPFLSFLCAGT